jgi:hypothetical protein
MLNIVIAWVILDIVAALIVLHDYHHRNVEPINVEENPPKTAIDSLPAA